jgi:hypothetical protein
MGSKQTSSPNSPSSAIVLKTDSKAKQKPTAASAPTYLALGVVAVLLGGAFAGPASAKASVQSGQNACKAAFQTQTPAPASFRLDSTQTRAQSDTLVYAYRVKAAGEDKSSTVTCTVDRNTNAVTLTAETAPPSTLAAR